MNEWVVTVTREVSLQSVQSSADRLANGKEKYQQSNDSTYLTNIFFSLKITVVRYLKEKNGVSFLTFAFLSFSVDLELIFKVFSFLL